MKSTPYLVGIPRLIFYLLIIFISQQAYPENLFERFPVGRTGLKIPTQQHLQEAQSRRVQQVKPNNRAVDRVNAERVLKSFSPMNLRTYDIEYDVHLQTPGVNALTTNTTSEPVQNALPEKVDNSTLDSFPPIGDQGFEGSCTTWATGYYQASHEYCLENGCNNKVNNKYRASPKFIYNMINFGRDGGSFSNDAYKLLIGSGYATMRELPYVAGDYLAWDLNTSHWISALSRRALSSQTLANVDTDEGMRAVKQSLANGHVLTYATWVYSWYESIRRIGTTVQPNPNDDPTKEPLPSEREYIVTAVNGQSGAHMMTLVGYDDTIWVDINNNGVEEPEELGAFKVANSWGPNWMNKGFLWVSYDAVGWHSKVPGFQDSENRVPLFWSNSVYALTARNAYKPRVVAQFTVNTSKRDHMAISVGRSESKKVNPAETFASGALFNQGGEFGLRGNLESLPGTFAMDLTDFVQVNSGPQNFYLKVNNSNLQGDSVVQVDNFSVVDLVNQKQVAHPEDFPARLRNQEVNFMVSYAPQLNKQPISAVITANVVPNQQRLIRFDGSRSTTKNMRIMSYVWDFGDGTPRFQGNPVRHRWKNSGNYMVRLIVTDNLGFRSAENYFVRFP